MRAFPVTALLTGASFLALGAAAPAYALCDAYSGDCPSTPPAAENPTTGSPVAGGDTGAGTGAGQDIGVLAGGTALVVAGRRKAGTTAWAACG